MVHTIARDLTRRADLAEVCAGVTTLAEMAIDAAVRLHHRALAADFGEPIGAESSAPQALVVVGMGKLGGAELNVSSDVDLVFLYAEDGDTDGARQLSNREFFERLGRRVIAALHEITADGFVFRVDMRLRPYGESGPLAVPFSALEQYLITQGRTWERYAWLKARALTGDADAALAEIVTPFVFRKYLDYDAYAGLRDVHRQIREQGARRDYAGNVKLGEGGIREVEFVVQALQIVRGGREPALRVRGTLPALAAIEQRGLLPQARCRRSAMPTCTCATSSTGCSTATTSRRRRCPPTPTSARCWPRRPARRTPRRSTRARRDAARGIPAVQLRARRSARRALRLPRGSGVAAPDADGSIEALAAAGYRDPDALLGRLRTVQAHPRYLQLPSLSRDRFDALVPQLLEAAAQTAADALDPQDVFIRLLDFLESVNRRSAYLALLMEHPPLIPRLAHLMGASAWAALYLTRHPILLDELLDARLLLAEPDWGEWRRELAARSTTPATIPRRRWTRCATSSTRRRSGCSCRTSRAT